MSLGREVLNTRVCRMFGIEWPILQAGMGYLARTELVVAVSNAGGLGVIGSTGNLDPDGLRQEIREVKNGTDKPFAVNLLFPAMDLTTKEGREFAADTDAKVETVLDEGVPVLSLALGVPDSSVIQRAHHAGTLVVSSVGAVRHAEKAVSAGVDAVIAQGWEAGGHNSQIATMPLIPQVAKAVNVPVIAAGGMASGAALVAALALGASGGWFGTVFAVSKEARAHQAYKERVLAAQDKSTVVSRAHSGKPARMILNDFAQYYQEHPEEILPFPAQGAKTADRAAAVRIDGDVERGAVLAGQISGLLTESEGAAEIVQRLVAEAIETLENAILAR